MVENNQVDKFEDNIVLKNYIQNQININRKAYEVYLQRERELFKQVLDTFKVNKTTE